MLYAVDSICPFSSLSNPWAFSAKQEGLFFNVTITAALWGDITWIRICFDGQCLNLVVLFWEVKSFFFNLFFNWRKIALQYCVGFCHPTMRISHNYTFITSVLNLLPSPSHSSRPSQSARLGFLCYTATSYQLSVLHMAVYICWCYFEKLNLKVKIPCQLVISLQTLP